MTEIWADIGGTFTDCLIAGGPTLKVLSSGLVPAQLVSASVIQVAPPTPENSVDLTVASQFASDGFWVGGELVVSGYEREKEQRYRIIGCRLLDKCDAGRNCVVARFELNAPLPDTWQRGDSCQLDAGLEAPILGIRLLLGLPLGQPLPALRVRLGTTRGTNALLTRTGAKVALLTTAGFGDLLEIGTQNRPDLFALDIVKPEPLASDVIEVTGRITADGEELVPLDPDQLAATLQQLHDAETSPDVLAICCLHSHVNDQHERQIEQVARQIGFERVVRSSSSVGQPRIVHRAETACLDAYLQPVLENYVARVLEQLGGPENCHLRWMSSNGNLVDSSSFRGRDSVLSGPAGGVVALAEIAKQAGVRAAVGLDMGGTSTDVSRFDGRIARRHENQISGVRVLAPMMDIHTVAAGGGSICDVIDGRLVVGPASAGAQPGPACYGQGGPLTVTDVNVLLGRLPVERFPWPLDQQASQQALASVAKKLPHEVRLSTEALAEGFLKIAITEMAEAVRTVTTATGNDVREMALVGFGGAAGGHLCRIAEMLDMRHVIDHPQSGVLSAVGIGKAEVGRIVSETFAAKVAEPCPPDLERKLEASFQTTLLQAVKHSVTACEQALSSEWKASEPPDLGDVVIETEIDLRYVGTQSTLSIPVFPMESLAERMDAEHRAIFGYDRRLMAIESTVIRSEGRLKSKRHDCEHDVLPSRPAQPIRTTMWVDGKSQAVSLFDRDELSANQSIVGPAIISGEHSVLVVEAGWQATHGMDRVIHVRPLPQVSDATARAIHFDDTDESVAMEMAARRVQGIAEAMGEVIRRTSVSVNVKERRDYSCAVFLADGSLVANAPHVPVHLGAMSHTVRSLIEQYPNMFAGDCYVSNDPYAGGSHLPDVTVVTPVFCDPVNSAHSREADFFVASRCHHAEIGGQVPGSMNPHARNLADEGVVIRNFALVRDGQHFHDDLRTLLGSGRWPSRNVAENLADIAAAQAAGLDAARQFQHWTTLISKHRLNQLLIRLLHVAGEATATWIESLGCETRTFCDQLDDGTPICVKLTPNGDRGTLTIDFSGTGEVHPRGFNATPSIVTAAVLYVLRCVCPSELPLCDGVLRRIDLRIPPGLLDPPANPEPRLCPAVVAGNVETSNRIVDVLLGALGVAAASQGTMNNFLVGDDTFGYYETIGGGAGATAQADGADGVHTHMTNTLITDPEILESRLPMRLLRFAIRRQSGGRGKHRGGDGLIREFEFLKDLTVSLITSRRDTRPYGIDGGEPGQPGCQTLSRSGVIEHLPAAASFAVHRGDRLRIETPGGGGFGTP